MWALGYGDDVTVEGPAQDAVECEQMAVVIQSLWKHNFAAHWSILWRTPLEVHAAPKQQSVQI